MDYWCYERDPMTHIMRYGIPFEYLIELGDAWRVANGRPPVRRYTTLERYHLMREAYLEGRPYALSTWDMQDLAIRAERYPDGVFIYLFTNPWPDDDF